MIDESFAVRFVVFVVLVTAASMIGTIAAKWVVAHTGPPALQSVVGAA